MLVNLEGRDPTRSIDINGGILKCVMVKEAAAI
jgi:hypothetical protein